MARPRTISREAVLEAAGAIVGERGYSELTLESVAAKAGISKGGLQYLFKSKRQLMAAMIEHYIQLTNDAVRQAHSDLPDTPGRPLKAYVLGNLEGTAIRRDSTTAALLSAAVAEPELLAPGRKEYRKSLQDLKKLGVNQELAMLVMCAVDGLMFTEFLQVDPYTAAERKRLVEALLELAETGQITSKQRAGRKADKT